MTLMRGAPAGPGKRGTDDALHFGDYTSGRIFESFSKVRSSRCSSER